VTQLLFPATVTVDDRGEVEGVWEYTTTDPWAVTLHLGPRVWWLFARDLLRDGLTAPAGTGDVQVTPDVGGNRDRVLVWLCLTNPAVKLSAARGTVTALLEAAYALVPAGTEDDAVDWPAEWALLADGPATAA
jgi:hypothetical protein